MHRRRGSFADGPAALAQSYLIAGFGPESFVEPPAFDPVWGTLGASLPGHDEGWLVRSDAEGDGRAVDVEILGGGFHVAGRIRTGGFHRLSDWLNMQSGFIAVHDAMRVGPRETAAREPVRAGALWVRLDKVILVAERSPVEVHRPGVPAVQKQQRYVRIVTSDYDLRGNVHLHADGSMTHFLALADPRFLPITDVTVRWEPDAALVTRFPFAMINREEMLTVLDESATPADDLVESESLVGGAAFR